MPHLATKYFGVIPFDEGDLYRFPLGLPGFEGQTSFVLLNIPSRRPLVFLQSTAAADLCFLAFPVLVVDPEYVLSLSIEDLQVLEMDTTRQPRIGEEVLVLALLTLPEGAAATANLMAPVVINLQNRLAVQGVRCDFEYSHQHPLPTMPRVQTC